MWCSFVGVRCGTVSSRLDYRRVLSISLTDCRLDGHLTPLGNLTEMIHFFGGSNIISGSIPQSFFSMPKMLNLYLDDNQLTGSIPPITSVNPVLATLSLSNNSLVGRIPESLSMMKGLETVFLRENSIGGTIPKALGQLASLQYLSLNSNSLTGTIPSTLRRLSSLRLLYLERNMLTGTIPVLDQPSLQVINLSGNYLTMGSLEEVPMSTFSSSALALYINLHLNCLVFRNPSNPSQDADATHCGGERVLQISYF
jgi:Leucine-rich repeat (LRR) protein